MKASIKFREEQKPLIRAKIPLSILNFPFQSGIIAGKSKELSLSLGTLFESGPTFKVHYRPNDSGNPFSFVFKTGIGHFGSPVSSPFTMSAEFNLVGNQNPSFFIHFKPQFGDFCFNKSHSSSTITKSLGSNFETQPAILKTEYFRRNLPSLAESAVAVAVENLFSGTVVSARTSFPVRDRAVVNFRWSLRFPAVTPTDESDTVILRPTNFSFRQCPLLVMNKIGIEHVGKDDLKKGKTGNADVAQTCLHVKKQLETIQTENGLLRSALNDLRSELASRQFNFPANNREVENSKAKYSDKKSSNGKGVEGDVNEDLKKA